MKRFLSVLLVALFSAVLLAPDDADARRLGGGRSLGKQSDFMKRDATRPPSQAGQQATRPPANGAAPGRSWMGPVAGIAAALGLAALASYLGLGEEFGTILLMALVVMVVLMLVRRFAAARHGPDDGRRPSYAGAGAGNGPFTARQSMQADPWAARAPSGASGAAAAAGGATPAPGQVAVAAVPADFDVERFMHAAKVCFVRLQAANDQGRADDLREFTSPEMFAELSLEMKERGATAQTTDVVTLDARLLGVEQIGEGGGTELASVRFEGMLREASDQAATPFTEVWNFTRPVNRSGGWVLAGIQQVD
jgi:predicted lipid-binding transport protein (Tim44 family)